MRITGSSRSRLSLVAHMARYVDEMLRVPAPFRFWALGANPPIMWEKPGDINRTYGVAPVLGNQSFGKAR